MPRLSQIHRVLVSAACSAAAWTATADAQDKVTFVDAALPVLRQRCGACHNADKKTAGLDVTTYAAIMQGGGSGEVIVPGDAPGSHLFSVANHDTEPKMPPDAPPIPEPERQVLRAWIDGGALENAGSVATVVKKVDVAMTTPASERPAVPPLPAHLPLEPVLRTAVVDACASIATSPWAPVAAVCGQKQVLLYRTDSLELAGVLPFPEGRPHLVRFSAGGGLVLAGGGVGAASGRVAVWNVKTGRRLRTLGEELDIVLAADVSPDQRLVAFGGPQKVVRIHSLETGAKLHDLVKHTDWIQAAAFSPDGVLLATTDRSGGAMVWEAVSGRDFLTLQGHPGSVTSVAWRGDSNMLATGCEDGQIRLWELENGTLVKAWPAHGGGVTAVDFTRDGRVVSVGRDRVPKIWTTDGAQQRAFEACADIGLAVAACDETNRVLVGDWTGEIRVWNGADGGRVGSLDPNPVAIADRVAAAEHSIADTKARLAQAVEASSVAAAAVAAATTAHAAAAGADPTSPLLGQLEASLTAARAEQTRLEAEVVDLKNQMAQAAAGHARWVAEVAFQANYERLLATLAEREQTLSAAEADLANAALRRQADEQVRQAAVARRDGMQRQIESLTAAAAASEGEAKDLAARIDQRGGEIAGLQGAIDRSRQAIVALDESAARIVQGLAAAPDDPALVQAQAGLVAATQAKQAQLQQQLESLAALTAEKAAWEQAVVDKRALAGKHGADAAAVAAAMPAVTVEIEAADRALAEATKIVEEKNGVVAGRKAEVDAAGGQLDALQGAQG
jgi:hypothetical protein